MDQVIALLRQLAETLERSQKSFSLDDPGTREALEALFNTWYESEYKDLTSMVESHEEKLDELPSDISDYDHQDLDSRISDLESKVEALDKDEIEDAVELSRQLDDVDVKSLSRLNFDELEEMMSFFRSMKAHFAPGARREAA